MASTSLVEADQDNTISFVQHLSGSDRFKELFTEGMQLVEAAAAYLDGPGRLESKGLPRPVAQAYSAESMRLTTRLMQIASWLLIRRAVSTGEMTAAEASAERVKVRVSAQSTALPPAEAAQLPQQLQTLVQHSLRLQARILHLDRMVNAPAVEPDPQAARRGLDLQIERLNAVYRSAV